ncbi:MAG: VWA domain-containing protein [Ilumatobacter sp.]|uniref:vWA domain-containing protein n=1 Tax=Ilumatobacter sp. TaxID=1967498 RepID=UPI00260DBC6A|nr:VWA domain-containing protein [Ilumatobacter sp.]MDJ0767740.1 VWA domain-containing protein [Ilumatobacter sp.]
MSAATRDAGEIAVAFSRVLRGAGIAVPTSSTIAFGEALTATGLGDRDVTYWAGRATLVRKPEDHEVYDRAFRVFWDHDAGATGETVEDEVIHLTLAVDDDSADEDDQPAEAEPSDDPVIELRFSATEVLRRKDFADYTAEELAEAQQLMGRLRLIGSPRRSLRLTAADFRTDRPDLRRTVREAMRAGGEPVRRHFRRPSTRNRRLVLLLDVSGSMEPYARALIRFVHAAVAGRQKVEAFALGTRLTRLTRELSSRDPDEALRRAGDRMADYGGGTRLGDGLGIFNDEWGQRGMARGAIVVILSDGWDRGDPEVLGEQMQRLHRVAHKVVWVNPLKVTPGYAPLARGMAAALPHVDAFVEGHSIEAIDELAHVISAP